MANVSVPTYSSVNSNFCRLCRISCADIQQPICDENYNKSEIYRITLKYFPAKFLEPRPEVLCLKCSRHILQFNSFQETIYETQSKLPEHENEAKSLDMSDSTNNNHGFDKKSNINNKTAEDNTYGNENCQNAVNKTIVALPKDDEIDIFLDDLKDIDIEFSSDDEKMNVSECLDTKKTEEKPVQKEDKPVTTAKNSSSKDCLNKDDKTTTKDDNTDILIRQFLPVMRCWICSKSLTNFLNLQSHFLCSHSRSQFFIKCCEIKFNNRRILLNHINLKHKVYFCDICNINYQSVVGLKKHTEREHSFICPECPKISKTQEDLEKHRNEHYVCRECNIKFQSTKELRDHKLRLHKRKASQPNKSIKKLNAAFSCKDCGKRMATKTLFDNHVKYAHIENRNFNCKICEKSFNKVLHFRDHMNTHTTEDYYACLHCKEKFQFWSLLESHLECSHKANKKYNCNICKKIFYEVLHFRDHMNSHTDENYYACSYCPERFQLWSLFDSHMENDHTENWWSKSRHITKLLAGMEIETNLITTTNKYKISLA